LGDFIIGLYIYIRARLDGGLQKQNTKISYTKKTTLSLYRYVCIMHRMRVPLRRTSVPLLELGLVGAAPISCLRMYLMVLFTLAFRNACTRKLLVIVFGDSLFVNFECSLFAFYWFLLFFCCFTSLQLLSLCSDVGHHFLQGVMLVAASLNRALVHLNHLKDH